jgi:hypothetical protein
MPGRGVHSALLALLAALRRRRYVVRLDIRRYFLSIDRAILIDEVIGGVVDALRGEVVPGGRARRRTPQSFFAKREISPGEISPGPFGPSRPG